MTLLSSTSQCLRRTTQPRNFIPYPNRRRTPYGPTRFSSDSSNISAAPSQKKAAISGGSQLDQFETKQSILSRLTSYASQTAQQSLNSVKQSATANLENKTQALKESITSIAQSSKERIKSESSQYVSDARKSINSLKEQVKTSAVANIQDTTCTLKKSITNATQSSKERIRTELSNRIRLPLSKSECSKTISNEAAKPPISQTTSAANLATKVIAETTMQAANNMTSQVKESVSQTTRWLWWWGLAAVGVYGISTTLTKEGIQTLKDLVSSQTSGAIDSKSVAVAADRSDEEEAKATWISSIKRFFGSNSES